LKNIRFCQIRL